MPQAKLPKWAKKGPVHEGRLPIIIVDGGAAYAALLPELAEAAGERLAELEALPKLTDEQEKERPQLVAVQDADNPTQYSLEVAYQCLKMDVQSAVGFGVEIHIKDAKKAYAQKGHPPGRGALAATQGREARGHYERMRGAVPQG